MANMTFIGRGVVAAALGAAMLCAGCSSAPSVQGIAGTQPVSQATAGQSEGTAVVDGAVQRISVDLSKGYYDPSVIVASADTPLEITFGEGQGCLASVLVPDFAVDQDLTAGPVVVKLPAMKAGEYEFSCGMRMVFGKIVVR